MVVSVLRLVWVDSLPTVAGPALIDVPKGTARALQDESDGEQQRDALNTELPPRPSGFRQFVSREEGGREGRGESGQDRYPVCNNASERKVLTTAGLWFQLTEPFQVFITHSETSDPVHSKHRHLHTHNQSQLSASPQVSFCFLFGLPHSTGTEMSFFRTTSKAQSKNAASYIASLWSKHRH